MAGLWEVIEKPRPAPYGETGHTPPPQGGVVTCGSVAEGFVSNPPLTGGGPRLPPGGEGSAGESERVMDIIYSKRLCLRNQSLETQYWVWLQIVRN